MSDVDFSDIETDADDIEAEDDRPEQEYDIVVKQEIYLRLRVSARDRDEAQEIGIEALRGMRYTTYISEYDGRDGAETIGITEHDRLCKDIHFDLPERPDLEDLTVEDV